MTSSSRHREPLVAALAALVVSASCGGRTETLEGTTLADAGNGGDGSAAQDICRSQNGFAVCGGPNDCFPQPAPDACSACIHDPGRVGICLNDALTVVPPLCPACTDGRICVEAILEGGGWFCVPFEVGTLFAANGSGDRVRYADFGLWTGEPLPVPATCPAIDGITLCGGNCAGCPVAQTCTGRSRLHPYGVCVPSTARSCAKNGPPCDAGEECFMFQVEPAAQALADENGLCISSALCARLASSYPGGASCAP